MLTGLTAAWFMVGFWGFDGMNIYQYESWDHFLIPFPFYITDRSEQLSNGGCRGWLC